MGWIVCRGAHRTSVCWYPLNRKHLQTCQLNAPDFNIRRVCLLALVCNHNPESSHTRRSVPLSHCHLARSRQYPRGKVNQSVSVPRTLKIFLLDLSSMPPERSPLEDGDFMNSPAFLFFSFLFSLFLCLIIVIVIQPSGVLCYYFIIFIPRGSSHCFSRLVWLRRQSEIESY